MLGSKDIFLDRAKRELSVMQMNHCGIQECEKGHMWQFQARPYHLLHFVLQGEGSLKISGQNAECTCRTGHFFIPCRNRRKIHSFPAEPLGNMPGLDFMQTTEINLIDLLFGKNEILDLALSAKELEKEILSIFVSYG